MRESKKFVAGNALAAVGLSFLGLSGCSDAPQSAATVELRTQGQEVQDWSPDGVVTLSLSRADVAFGPLYLCPGSQAGELCDVARLEWTGSTVVDALDPTAREAGSLEGVTGPVNSWMFDYGFTSLLTREVPVMGQAAEELGGVSLVVEGEASVEEAVIPFSLRAIVRQGEDAEQGVQVVRKSSGEAFSYEVTQDTRSLTVRFDPKSFLSHLEKEDFLCGVTVCEDAVDWQPESAVARATSLLMSSGVRPEFRLE